MACMRANVALVASSASDIRASTSFFPKTAKTASMFDSPVENPLKDISLCVDIVEDVASLREARTLAKK